MNSSSNSALLATGQVCRDREVSVETKSPSRLSCAQLCICRAHAVCAVRAVYTIRVVRVVRTVFTSSSIARASPLRVSVLVCISRSIVHTPSALSRVQA